MANVRDVVSLGLNCISAQTLKNLGLQTGALPFDWLAGDPDMVADCISNDCAVLLSRDQYVFERHYRHVRQHGVRDYSKKYRRAIIFHHSDPTTESGYRYLESAVERLVDILDTSPASLFLMVGYPERIKFAKLDRLERVLKARTKQPLLLTVIVHRNDPDLPEARITLEEETPNRVVYSVIPRSKLGGLHFGDRKENAIIERLVRRHVAV